MSTTYAKLLINERFMKDEPLIPAFRVARSMLLTSFSAGELGQGVQITLLAGADSKGGNAYFCLTERQAQYLAFHLLRPYYGDVEEIDA